jgi:hypothetical protein
LLVLGFPHNKICFKSGETTGLPRKLMPKNGLTVKEKSLGELDAIANVDEKTEIIRERMVRLIPAKHCNFMDKVL